MTVKVTLDKIEEIIASAWRVPMTGGKCMVNAEILQNLIDDLKLALPKEIKQAKIIVEDKDEILNNAMREAESIVQTAQNKAKKMIVKEEITRHAQNAAHNIYEQARTQTTELRKRTNSYVEEIFVKVEQDLIRILKEFKETHSDVRKVIKENETRSI